MSDQPKPARVAALFVSPRKGAPMESRRQVQAWANHGFEDDAHARPGGDRQVLLLDAETLAEFGLASGTLKENITTEGLDVAGLAPGARLQAGGALLEITKPCAPCTRWNELQAGLQEKLAGRRGQLARVLEGGLIRTGAAVEILVAGRKTT